jgi:hypothetical protein
MLNKILRSIFSSMPIWAWASAIGDSYSSSHPEACLLTTIPRARIALILFLLSPVSTQGTNLMHIAITSHHRITSMGGQMELD